MNLISKYYNRFLSYKAVFCLDLFLSLAASVIVLLVMTFFAGSHSYYAGTFSLWWLGSSVVATVVALFLFKSYRLVIRHTSFPDVIRYFLTALVKVVLMGVVVGTACLFNFSVVVALGLDFLVTLLFFVGVRVLMMTVYNYHKQQMNELKHRRRVLVYGITDKSVASVTRLHDSPHYHIVGFLSHDNLDRRLKLSDISIYYYDTESELEEIVNNLSVSGILFATENDVKNETALVSFCSSHPPCRTESTGICC